MKYILYSIIAFLAIVFFLPENGSGLRNPFLFVAIVLAILCLLSLRAIKKVRMIFRIRKILASNGYRIVSCRILPICGKFDVVAEDRSCKVNVVARLRKHFLWQYRFIDPDRLELWKTVDPRRSAGGIIAKRSGGSMSTRERTVRLPWKDSDMEPYTHNFFITDKRPSSITDRHANKEFDNGDKVCSKIVYYELKAFASAVEKL